MTELTGTQASTEDVPTNKKVLTENVEVAPPVLGRKHLLSLIKRYNKEQEKEHSSYMKRGSGKNDWYDTRDSLTNNVLSVEKEIYKYYGKLKDASGKTLKSVGISAYDTSDPIEFVNAWMPSETVKESKPSLKGIFNSMLNENDQITIQPAKQNTQVIKQGQKTLGTVENPQLAQQIKQSIGKGEMTLAGDELEEGDVIPFRRPANKSQTPAADWHQVPKHILDLANEWYWMDFATGSYDAVTDPNKSDEKTLQYQTALLKQKGWSIDIDDNYENIVLISKDGKRILLPIEDAQDSTGWASEVGALNEKWGTETKVAPSEKGKYEGKTKAELLKQYNALKAKGPHKKGSPDYGKMRELAFAIRAKSDWGKVDETDMGQADARKSAPSSKEEQEKVFSRTREKSRNLRAELDADPELLTKKVSESVINEKAVSKSQQQAAGAALAAKRGDAPKSKLKGASKEMAKMSTKELEKFAGTKHKGLPDKKEKTDESSSGVRIVHNKLLGGWFIVRGPHQTPISGKFSSKEEAEKSLKQKEKPTANEAAMPTHDGDFGAGLGAGRSQTTLEAKKTVKKDDKAEKAGKKVTKDIEYDEKVKDKIHGKKRKAEDDKAEKAGKKVAKDIEYDMKKKKVNESMNHNKLEAARLRGKAHALAKESYNCKYDEGTEERNAYHEGFKEGLDECYGVMPIQGLVVGEEMPATVPGMASNAMPAMEADMEEGNAFTAALARTPKGGKFTVGGKTFTDKTSYDTKVDEMDMMAFEAWDRELNELLNEGKMKDLDMDLGNAKGEPALSDAKFKEKYGKTKAEMKKSLSSDSKNKTPVKEGISVSVSKGQQGAPDSVTVSAQDQEADALLSLIKQAGLGLFGGDDQQASNYGAPVSQDQVTAPQGGDVGDHDSMMSLIKKMSSGSNDYEDEESHDDSTCPGCGSSDCGCDDESDSKALVVGEDETEDQMEFEVAEANAPDSDQAETTADENAEAEEDKALAQAAQQNKTDTFNEGGDGGEASEEDEELTEWANDAGYTGSENTKDNTFEEDIDFMTRVISGGLNGPKKDQTTLPHTRVKVDESIQALNEWKKLSGI